MNAKRGSNVAVYGAIHAKRLEDQDAWRREQLMLMRKREEFRINETARRTA